MHPNNYNDLIIDADVEACALEKETGLKLTDSEYSDFVKDYIQIAVKTRLIY